jgi:hypothetical protein
VLLHQRLDVETLIQVCSVIYDVAKPLDANSFASVTDPLAQNIIEFIRGLRAGVNTWNRVAVYALLVFDFALIQLEGLSFGSSGNRIADPRARGRRNCFRRRMVHEHREAGYDIGCSAGQYGRSVPTNGLIAINFQNRRQTGSYPKRAFRKLQDTPTRGV